MVLPRERLFKMADDLLPNDVLTVVCEMEVTVVVKVSESTLVNESTSSNNGTKLLIENLQNAFENPRFSDVTLKVGDVQFPAHKIILANRSKVFDAMFDSEMKESQENVVNLVEMKPSVAKAMLSYIYSGSIQELSVDRATDLYVAADRYDMPELKQWCKDFILKHISPDFACDVAILANLHDDEELAKASKHTIKNNLKAVLSSEKWLSLSKESPAVYLELLQVALLDDSD
ncbi:speckle-type POZ protein-like [Uloborus diversus]|uniref:speckle-type POZ protein-like n=1 Tax=Uloborus diversus TaxID=327109 RepID=UPI002409BDF3|nr:speckle-type POZ protein-like [Uloborus diversus]